jgi:hypothetical protein
VSWKINGSGLEFSGSGTFQRTNNVNPTLNTQYAIQDHFYFSFFRVNPDGKTIDVTLPDSMAPILGTNGPTRNVRLTKS